MKRAAYLVPVLALALAAPARAYVREATNWNPSSLPIRYSVNTSTIPSSISSTGVAAVDAGFATWAAPSCTSWQATNVGSTTRGANAGDAQNTILWVSGSWPAELGDVYSVIGVTTPVWYSGGYFSAADIRFNNVGFDWSTSGSASGSTVDTQSIATHEEGHFLGLDHTGVGSAIMYASYSGGQKRTLASDDINGVCAIYPSGSAPPPTDAGTSTDRCSAFGNTCGDCTPNAGCGFCTATSQCVSGTQTGPSSGTCASGYVWYPADCTASAPGTGRVGDPCGQATDCSTSLCITDGRTAWCSRACTDDCGCPDGYGCVETSDPSLKVCAPGTRSCSPPPPVDAGTTPPPVDAGPRAPDAGPPQTDAATPLADAGMEHMSRGACGCSAPGRSDHPSFLWLAALAPLLVLRRRR